MMKIAIITAALLVTSTSAFAGHAQVGDAARTPAGTPAAKNQSSNAARGYMAISNNPTTADEAADKTE